MPEMQERVAVLEANYVSHFASDTENFDRIFGLIENMKTEILEKLKPIDIKVSSLWDDKNKREGAFGFSRIIAGGVGGLIGALGGVAAAVELFK